MDLKLEKTYHLTLNEDEIKIIKDALDEYKSKEELNGRDTNLTFGLHCQLVKELD